MLFNGFRGEHYMENKELSININEDKLKIAKQKNENSANYKLIYAGISTIVTVFSTIYSDEKQLVILAILLFIIPNYLEARGVSNKNSIIKKVLVVYKVVFLFQSILLFIIFVWYTYNKIDAYCFTKSFVDYLLYSSIFVNLLYSLFSYFNLRYNISEHLALVVIEESTLEKQKERLKFQDNIKEEHKKTYRNFVGNPNNKGKRGKNK